MIKSLRGVSSSKFLLLTLTFLILTDLFVVLDIPILRQFSGFIFLTFVPGFLILAILKLDKLGMVEKIVLSVGLSISFVMLFGLLVNYLSLAVGYTKPLSTFPMLTSFGIATIILAAFAYRRNKDITLSFPRLGLTVREKLLLITPSLFPLLSIIGMRLMNTTDNNFLLMLLLLLIPAYVIFIAVYQSKVPERLYPAFTYLIGISILLLLSLRSNHILGADILESYYIFQTTLDQMYWSIPTPSLLNSLLSISLLPSIYQIFIRINPEYLYKLFFPVLCSVLPLVVYVIARKYVGSFYAFLTSFLLMSQVAFLWTAGDAHTVLAILFCALAIMVHFHDGINEFAGRLFFLVFAVSSVVTHYSTTYVFFFMLLSTWIGTQVLYWIHLRWKGRTASTQSITTGTELNDSFPSDKLVNRTIQDPTHMADKGTSSSARRGTSMTIILLFFVVIFLWHSQITGAAFDNAVNLIFRTLKSMNESFLIETKGSEVRGAFGQMDLPTIPQQMRFYFHWLTVIFILVGGLSIAVRYKRAVAYPYSEHIKATFLESKFELEYFAMSAACGFILTSAVVLPYISATYNMERTYFQSLTVLSPYFVICGMMIARWLRIRPYLIILPILIPFFMSVTGTTYQLFNVPASIVLNSTGTEYEHIYISDEESSAAKWLAQNYRGSTVYTDYAQGPRILASQGGISRFRTRESVIAEYRRGNNIDGYIYLFYPAVVKGEAPLTSYAHMDIVALPELLATRNELYTNESVEIYR